MTQISIKEAINSLEALLDSAKVKLIDVLRPWMVITNLEFEDAVHLNYGAALEGLLSVHSKLKEMTDVLDDDQLQEAACRCLKSIVVYGDDITDGEIAVRRSQRISWDGNNWNYTADPSLRQRGTSKSYLEALAAVREMMGD